MPISLKKVNNASGTTLDVHFGKEVLQITYSRAKYTPKREQEMNEQLKDVTGGIALATMLSDVLLSWDVVDIHPDDADKPDGKQRTVPVPLNYQTLTELLSGEALGKISDAIRENQSPKKETPPPSEPTFSPMGGEDT